MAARYEYWILVGLRQVRLSLRNIVNHDGDSPTTPSRHRSLYHILGHENGCSVQKTILEPLRRKLRDSELCDYAVHATKQSRIPPVSGCLSRYSICTALAQSSSIQTLGHRYSPQSRTERYERLPRRVPPPPGAQRPLRVHLLPRWAHEGRVPYYRY